MSEWREIWLNGLPSAGRLPKSCHRMAAKGIQFPWRWTSGTISTNLDVILGISVVFSLDRTSMLALELVLDTVICAFG